MNRDVLLNIKGLAKHFRLSHHETLLAVDHIDLQLYRGEVLGLVGESGSGKSTLGRLIVGLHDKTAGRVEFEGHCLPQYYQRKDFQKQAQSMQMIFQDPTASLNPRMTIEEIIAEPLRLLNKSVDIAQTVNEWLYKVNLPKQAIGRYPHEFSGGQRQRIGIARALISEPTLLICDEPISALDVSVQAQVVNLLADLRQELGLSILFIAHDLSMVRYISDRIAVMYLGQLMEVADTKSLFGQPLHPYTQLLLASNPVIGNLDKSQSFNTPRVISNHQRSSQGCSFAPRCPRVQDHCRQNSPVLRMTEDARQVACHYVT